MNHERSHNGDPNSPYPKKHRIVISQPRTEYLKSILSPSVVNRSRDNYHIISFRQALWFWLEHSPWFYFGCGLFWGSIIGLTAMISAGAGVALTKIDAVEKAIAKTINRDASQVEPTVKYSLDRPVNVLLLEIKPINDEMLKFSQAFAGESQTILLLKFQPQLGKTQIIYIPPDSRVKIPGYGWGTIADANLYGGTELVSQIVAQLLGNVTIDRYIRANPKTFQQLIASGKITLNHCDLRSEDCSNENEQILRQKAAAEAIRQRLNIPNYLRDFGTTLTTIQPNLDTDLSLPEAMSIANFVKELEQDKIKVNLIPNYIPSQTIELDSQLSRVSTPATATKNVENQPIAVQNTTDSPELGMRFVAYLRRQNFQDVYLVKHLPLRLNKTKIVVDRSQLAEARYLKSLLGFGGLEPRLQPAHKPLTIQIGEDAQYLPLDRRK